MDFETGERFRADKTSIPINILGMAVTLLFVSYFIRMMLSDTDYGDIARHFWIPALAASIFYPIRWWKLTTYRLGETGVEVKRETWFRLDKIVPYGKIASVNLTRMLPNRIMGTSNVIVNANAGPSAVVPEASIWLKVSDADMLKAAINARISGPETEAVRMEDEFVSLIKFTAKDSVIQGIFGQPTISMVVGAIFLASAVVSFLLGSHGTTVTTALLFVLSYVVPVAINILKFYDFRIRRIGDTIHVRHGAIWNYSSSFETVKVNAIRVKKPFLARLIGKSSIEAEVIGAAREMEKPLLCLMVKDEVIPYVISELLPEFSENTDLKKQPKKAAYPLLAEAAFRSLVTAVALFSVMTPLMGVVSEFVTLPSPVVDYGVVGAIVLAALFHFWWMDRRMRIEALALGEDTLTVVRGVVDRERVTMMYDRVQIVRAVSNPFSRPFGLSRCNLSLLSSVGATTERTGYFETEALENIGDILVERIKSGKRSYSYKSF